MDKLWAGDEKCPAARRAGTPPCGQTLLRGQTLIGHDGRLTRANAAQGESGPRGAPNPSDESAWGPESAWRPEPFRRVRAGAPEPLRRVRLRRTLQVLNGFPRAPVVPSRHQQVAALTRCFPPTAGEPVAATGCCVCQKSLGSRSLCSQCDRPTCASCSRQCSSCSGLCCSVCTIIE